MTRRERQDKFSKALHEWLEANVGSLTVAEVAGIMQVHMTTMILDSTLDEEEEEEDWRG